MSRLHQLRQHICEGTIFRRILWELSYWVKQFSKTAEERARHHRQRVWNIKTRDIGYFDFEICPGGLMRLHRHNALAQSIFIYDFEISERTFLERYLQRGDVFVDVGANIGLFTIIGAICVGPRGKIFAIEPATSPRRRLEENVRINGFTNVSVQGVALSDQDGLVAIHVPSDGFDAWSSIGVPIVDNRAESELVQSITWEKFISDNPQSEGAVMVKIDVEGWESRVLKGGRRAFSDLRAPLLQVEFTDAAAVASGSSCSALYKTLTELGYIVCRYDLIANRLVPDAFRPSYPYVNLYATKDIMAVNNRLASR